VLALSNADSSVTPRQFYSYAICHMAASFSETAPQALPDWSHYILTVIQQNSCHCWAWHQGPVTETGWAICSMRDGPVGQGSYARASIHLHAAIILVEGYIYI